MHKSAAVHDLTIDVLLMTHVVHHLDLDLALIRPHREAEDLGRRDSHAFGLRIID